MARFDFRQKPFRLYGVPFFDSTGKLERVPEDVAKQCNDGVVTLSKRCPGARLRFCTDSRKISFRPLKGTSCTWEFQRLLLLPFLAEFLHDSFNFLFFSGY